MATDPRLYSDDEVALILRRAAELAPTPAAAGPGTSLAELEEIGREAGLDPRRIREAAATLATRPEGGWKDRVAGGPLSIEVRRHIPHAARADRLERLIPMIEAGTSGYGNASVVGSTLTWSSTSTGNTAAQQVLVSSADGETVVRIEENIRGLAAGLFGGWMGGLGGGVGFGIGGAVGGVLSSGLAMMLVPAVMLPVSYGIARHLYGREVRKRRRALEALADRICETLEQQPPGVDGDEPRVLAPGET